MAPTNVDLLTPGRVVFVQGLSDLQDGHFGIITPVDFWEKHASKRQKEICKNHESPHLPIFEFGEAFSWGVCFSQKNLIIPHENLLDEHETFGRFWSFTHRDGSRYYKKFYREVCFIQTRICEGGFSNGEDGSVNHSFVNSLVLWKRENQK